MKCIRVVSVILIFAGYMFRNDARGIDNEVCGFIGYGFVLRVRG